jgi:hypothetical protein
MGVRMSFDKHVSSLDELLDMSAPYFSKVRFESRINPNIEQHLKVKLCSCPHNRYLYVDLVFSRGQIKV